MSMRGGTVDPDLEELYLAIKEDIQGGKATPEEAATWLEGQGLPSFRALGQAYAATLGPTPEEQVEAESGFGQAALDAVGSVASALSQAGTLGLIDDAVAGLDPSLGKEMERVATETRSEQPIASGLLDVGLGLAAPGAVMTRGGAGLIARGMGGAALGTLEGAAAGYGHTAQDGNKLVGTGVGAGAGLVGGGLATVLGAPVIASMRRMGVGSGAGPRLAGRLAELTQFGGKPANLFDWTGASQAMRNIGEAAPTMRGRTVQLADDVRTVGEEAFGRFQNRELFTSGNQGDKVAQKFFDDMMDNPVTRPFVRSIRREVQGQADAAGPWTFQEAQRIHRRLSELARLKGLDPKAQADSETLGLMAKQVREILDDSTDQMFSEANRLYARTAEVDEAFRIGAGHVRRDGLTELDLLAGDMDPDRMEFILEQFADNPAADAAFREGLRTDFTTRAQTSAGQGVVNLVTSAAGGMPGDRAVVRAMFPRGREGTRQFNQFLSAAKRELGTDRLSKAATGAGRTFGRGQVARAGGLFNR